MKPVSEWNATTLFVEGAAMSADVEAFFYSTAEPGPHFPARQTIWPRPMQFRLRADRKTLDRMAELAASHAEPEVLDHLFVYAGDEPLIEYPDAFSHGGSIFLSGALPETRVRWIAEELRLEIARA